MAQDSVIIYPVSITVITGRAGLQSIAIMMSCRAEQSWQSDDGDYFRAVLWIAVRHAIMVVAVRLAQYFERVDGLLNIHGGSLFRLSVVHVEAAQYFFRVIGEIRQRLDLLDDGRAELLHGERERGSGESGAGRVDHEVQQKALFSDAHVVADRIFVAHLVLLTFC